MNKLIKAINGIPDINDEPPKGWISMEKHVLVYTVEDGNHRLGLTNINGGIVPFLIIGIWPGGRHFGFNLIIKKINSELRGSLGNY